MKSTFFFAQDSLSGNPSNEQDSVSSLKKFSNQQVDDIFKAMEQKEKELDSIARLRAYYAYLRSLKEQEPQGFDTTAVPYYYDQDSIQPGENPLIHFSTHFYSPRDSSKPIFIEQETPAVTHSLVEVKSPPLSTSEITNNLRPDWFIGIIIGCLILLAWLKLFYNRFLDQTMQSLVNYQLSSKLLRDQNMFSRRVAFALNVNFIIVLAAYIYLIGEYFHTRLFAINGIFTFLAYLGIITALLLLRNLSSIIIGYIFKKHGEFREYQYQLLLIHKNLGIYLLVLIIGIAYIHEDLRVYLIYISGLLILAALAFRIARGFKIVLNNKDVLIFYLILYLCTLEILPLLIFYRFFSLSVLTG